MNSSDYRVKSIKAVNLAGEGMSKKQAEATLQQFVLDLWLDSQ